MGLSESPTARDPARGTGGSSRHGHGVATETAVERRLPSPRAVGGYDDLVAEGLELRARFSKSTGPQGSGGGERRDAVARDSGARP